jgi:hypothetical protein
MARVFISHSSRDNESAERIKIWLAEQGFDTPFLDYDKHAGIPPGADWEKTLYLEIERSEAVVIIQTPNWLDSNGALPSSLRLAHSVSQSSPLLKHRPAIR